MAGAKVYAAKLATASESSGISVSHSESHIVLYRHSHLRRWPLCRDKRVSSWESLCRGDRDKTYWSTCRPTR